MASNLLQFQPGMSLPEFFASFGTEAQCQEALRLARWPHGFRCPRCETSAHYVVGHGTRRLFQCNACQHQTSLTSSSLMDNIKLPLTTWFLAIYLVSQAKTGISLARSETLPRRELPDRVAVASEDQSGDVRTRRDASA